MSFLSVSSVPSYLSLSDIIATGERLQVHSLTPLSRLSFLSPATCVESADDGNEQVLPAGSRMELPIWMVTALVKAKAKLKVKLPEIYSPAQRPILAADPSILALPTLGPQYFYETGRHLLRLAKLSPGVSELRDDEELGRVLVQIITRRFRYILDSSTNSDESDSLVKMDRLDLMERDLYAGGQRALRGIKDWFERNTDKIYTSEMVVRHRKRKANVMS